MQALTDKSVTVKEKQSGKGERVHRRSKIKGGKGDVTLRMGNLAQNMSIHQQEVIVVYGVVAADTEKCKY